MTSPSSHRLTIRLTGEEYLELRAKAGDVPLSTYMRRAALTEAAKARKAPVKVPKADQKALAQILALLGRSDVHTGLKGINTLALDDPARAEALIAEACLDLGAIKSLLMDALGVAER